jgi:hypothetical protein
LTFAHRASTNALENLLIDKEIATKDGIRSAASLAEKRLVLLYRSLPAPSEKNFGSDLTKALGTLLIGEGR